MSNNAVVKITDILKEQILIIRDTGVTNMFDSKAVQYYAYQLDFYELVTFIEEHPKDYFNFILTGKCD